jgi:Na+/H+-dicarboxylate symporter
LSGEKSAMFLSRRVLLLIYIGVGIAIAWTHDYFNHLGTWRQILSALLAMLLWPLVLLGISLHIHK